MTFLTMVLSLALAAVGQQEPAGRGRGRETPPQPQQKQGVEYFTGRWSFTWTGRESPITAGPRKGTTVFASAGSGLDIRTEGTVEEGNTAFTESGTAQWDEAKKALTLKETLVNGTTLTGTGDWASPLAIRYESEPAQIGNQSVRIRRTYTILSAQSFSIAEEISIDGGPFQRLGNGLFQKE